MNEHTISMTAFIPTLLDENKLIYRLSRTIRLLSVFDAFLGLFMFFFGNIGLIMLIRIICSISGYYGAKYYKHGMSCVYMAFITLSTVGELGIILI